MSLFGDDDDLPSSSSSRPKQTTTTTSSSLFADDLDPRPRHSSRATSNSLFADDDDHSSSHLAANDDSSPWGFPRPRKSGGRAGLVKSLLPGSEVPERYIDAFDALVQEESEFGGSGSGLSVERARKLVGDAGLGEGDERRIWEIVRPGDGDAGLERGEFNVLFALLGLALEGDEVTLDGVDERRKNLPIPSVSLPKSTKHEPQAAEPSPSTIQSANTASTQSQAAPQPSTPSRSRAPIRKQSFGEEADPWNSPDVHRGHDHTNSYTTSSTTTRANGLNAPSATRTTSGFTTTSSTLNSSTPTLDATTGPRPSSLGSDAGWEAYNTPSFSSSQPPQPYGSNPNTDPTSTSSTNHPSGLGGLPPHHRALGGAGGRIASNGVEEIITVTSLPEKEGVFLFQHRNYEVASARRNAKVVRRYSDFVWLLDCLHKRFPFRQLPLLPPKRVAINGNYIAADASFVEKRRRGLARFANALVRHPVLGQEQLVVMFLTVPTELAVWRKQANLSIQEEFVGKPLPPDLEDSLPKTLPELFDTVRSGVRRSAEIYINLCNMTERLTKRNEGIAAEYLRFSTALVSATEASRDTYAVDTNDVPLLNDGLQSAAKHLDSSRALLEDEARGWEEGVLEDMKRQRDTLVSVRDLFDRRDRYARDNIPYLEKRIKGNEEKLRGIRGRPEGTVKPGEAEKVEDAIFKDKESIVQQHARGVFIKECIRDELLYFQTSQYHVSRLHQEWSQERVKYAELQADNWRALSEEVEGMPLGD